MPCLGFRGSSCARRTEEQTEAVEFGGGTAAEDWEGMEDSSLQSLRILFVKEGFQEEEHVLESEKPSCYTGHRDEG